MRLIKCLLEALAFTNAIWALPTDQIPLGSEGHTKGLVQANKKRPLHGRFLHVTDFHPDSFYQVYSSTTEDSACHRGTGPAGIYGAETSECDSPFGLINKTFEWIGHEFKDNIDFVVWTGDSARHDNDDELPRNTAQVAGLNEFMVQKMFETFGKHNGDEEDEDPNNDFEIPIVPNLGNNDVLPHNIMTKGPNQWTRAYTRIWRRLIPEAQVHAFEQGGWFYVETIPHKLAVFSLNTLYFFQSNAAVDGCAAKSEPGYRQMEWLRIQLQYMRDRGMKAILIGHVPPARADAKKQWDETCWQKYTLWLQQYRDVVIAGLWGHMNYDHFFLQDFRELNKDTLDGRMKEIGAEASPNDDEDDIHAKLSSDYFINLRQQWSKLPKPPKSLDWIAEADQRLEVSDEQQPGSETERVIASAKKGKDKISKDKKNKDKKSKDKKRKQEQRRKKFLKQVGGDWAENFAVSFASASVVPNLLPVVRVFEYNITGLDAAIEVHEPDSGFMLDGAEELWLEDDDAIEPSDANVLKKKKKKPLTHKFIVPRPPSKSAPPGPAYSPQTLSLLGYTQYLANLTHINNDFAVDEDGANEIDADKWHEGKHKGKQPHEKDHTPNPKKFKFQLHYDTRNDSVYSLPDLTIRSMLGLARRIGAFVPENSIPLGQDERELASKKKGGKHHKKKNGSKREHRKQNEAWYTFIRRAFIETMDSEDIEEEFGH